MLQMKLTSVIPELTVLIAVVWEVLSNNPKLSSGHCCELIRRPSGPIFADFGGDLFIDIL